MIVGGLLLGAVYALFSSGLTLVWGMMNVVNFAHGDFVMLGIAASIGVPTLRLSGHYFSMATIAVAEPGAAHCHQHRISRRRSRRFRPDRATQVAVAVSLAPGRARTCNPMIQSHTRSQQILTG